jgi:hypothetical protein
MQSQVTQVGGLPRMVVRVDLDRQTVETVVDFEKKWRP